MGGVPVVDAASVPLVGREYETSRLTALLGIRPARLPSAETSTVVLVDGDAGVGKTRLLSEVADGARNAGWQVVVGHCLDFGDDALPYLPFTEVIGRLSADLPAVVSRVLETRPALARLQPGDRLLSRPGDAARGTARESRPPRVVRGRPRRPGGGRRARRPPC